MNKLTREVQIVMKKLTEKQYYYIQDALLSKFYEQEKLLWEKMSKILVNINKQISLLNNNEINSVIQMIKNRRTELSMVAGSKLSVGQKVQFNGRYGMTIKGRLTKINQKTAIVSESNSPKQWKVSISLLEAA